MPSLGDILDGKGICVCAGSGGVGKTTTSAAIATGMAARGLKVCVLTIDPAKRLADSLGLKELGNEAKRVDPKLFERHGIEMKGEEILLFDAHGPRGHWHKGGYDKLGARGSHQGFPEGMVDPVSQFAWSLEHLRTHAREFLAEAGHPAAAAALEPALLAAALDAVRAHVEQEGDLRTRAIAQGLLVA